MTFRPMRPQIEVERIHDMLMDTLSDHHLAEAVIPEEMIRPLMMVADCLCWMLHHDVDDHPDAHASNFACVIQLLGESLAGLGDYIVEE